MKEVVPGVNLYFFLRFSYKMKINKSHKKNNDDPELSAFSRLRIACLLPSGGTAATIYTPVIFWLQ